MLNKKKDEKASISIIRAIIFYSVLLVMLVIGLFKDYSTKKYATFKNITLSSVKSFEICSIRPPQKKVIISDATAISNFIGLVKKSGKSTRQKKLYDIWLVVIIKTNDDRVEIDVSKDRNLSEVHFGIRGKSFIESSTGFDENNVIDQLERRLN